MRAKAQDALDAILAALGTLTGIALPVAKREKPQKTGSTWLQSANSYLITVLTAGP